MKECKFCGNEVPKRNQYCDNKCQQDHQLKINIKEWLSGINKTRKGGNTIPTWMRTYLLNESNYECSECGWNEKNKHTKTCPLDVHHIDGNAYNNIKNNLIVLCPNCHSLTKTYKNIGNRKSSRINR